jgi:DNA polymerase-3 subunit epsilon
MREVVLDTETTGLDPADGHRIVEIGAVELINHIPSGRNFHVYLNPERDMPPEAEAVHGLSGSFLRDKPVFATIVGDLVSFLDRAPLVIHNAAFDIKFLNAELGRAAAALLEMDRVIDTLLLARQKHPTAANSLDALCKRYGIDNSRRDKHGALLDAELLAEVYLELIGGRQATLVLASGPSKTSPVVWSAPGIRQRPRPLPPRLTDAEREAHAALVSELGKDALWLKIER